ncbi:predicted outer membrane protein [gamma proteobacterium HdN1]|nr:predicted outer membrane protein [gamma proteobacterium HdN1]
MCTRWLAALLLTLAAGWVYAAPLDVNVSGGTQALRQNVKLHLSDLDTRDLLQPRRLETNVLTSTNAALNALGYYDAEIKVSGIEKGAKEIKVRITPGKAVTWLKPDVVLTGEGESNHLLQRWIAREAPKRGDVLNHAKYDDFKRGLREFSIQQGYFDAHWTRSELRINRDKHSARMRLTLDTVQRYHFGEVVMQGTRIEQARLHQFLRFKPGDPYQESKVTELYKSLLDCGFFKDLNVKADRDQIVDRKVPIIVNLIDDRAHHFNVGLGYGTDSGARSRFQWNKPVINDYGHSTGATLQLTERQKSMEFEYKIPDGHPLKNYYLGQASYIDELIGDTQVQTTSFTFSHNHEFENLWVRNLYVTLTQENKTEGISNRFFVTPGFAFSQLVLRGTPIIREGHRYLFETEYSNPTLGADTRFYRVHGLAKWLVPVSERQQVLLKVEGGYIDADEFFKVPYTRRFFAGGDQSIRGYGYQTLSPKDANNNTQGARYLSLASTEYLYRFLDRWQWALFVDRGRAFNNSDEPYHTGIGTGIRWLSPVGNIRLDIAKRVDDNNKGYEFHIFMGPPL